MRPQNESATDTKPKSKSSVKNDDRVNDRVSDRVNDRVNFADKILLLVEKSPGLRSKDLAALAGKSIPTLSRFLKGLKDGGKIEFRGARKNGGYFVKCLRSGICRRKFDKRKTVRYGIMAAYQGIMEMESKKKVYVETSVVSNLTARRSYNLIDAARQATTQTWWDTMRCEFDLFVSLLVIDEASKGDSEASRKRLDALKEMSVVTITREMEVLAERLLEATAVPRSSYEDAVHIAAATVGKMDYLLTWNCKHIANAVTMPKIFKVCNDSGYQCPIICTPEQLGKEEDDG